MSEAGISAENFPAFHGLLKDRLTYPQSFRHAGGDFAGWRGRARAHLRSVMLGADLPASIAEPEVLGVFPRDGYTLRRLRLDLVAGIPTEAALLVPDGEGPFPACVLLHDHGGSFDIGIGKMIETVWDDDMVRAGEAWTARFYERRFVGDELARRGHVVLVIDSLGWGSRYGNGFDGQQALAANMLNLGLPLPELMALEDVLSADWLARQPEVDAARVAAFGFSMGAFRAWHLAALSDRIAATVAVGWMATRKGVMVAGNNMLRGHSAFHMLHPALVRDFDYPDIASLAAPAPMLMHGGALDPLFPEASAREALAQMEAVWAAAGVPDRLSTRLWPVPHVFTIEMQDQAIDWLRRMPEQDRF